ncbi:hypothetical protein V2J60_24780, partial [Pseudomonas alliivorans]|nr:hypothetical protein [Pseudomonas alliivorans]
HGTARQKCNGKPLPDCLAGGVYGSHTAVARFQTGKATENVSSVVEVKTKAADGLLPLSDWLVNEA